MKQKRGCGCGAGLVLAMIGVASLVLLFPFVGLMVFVLASIGALAYGWLFARKKKSGGAEKGV